MCFVNNVLQCGSLPLICLQVSGLDYFRCISRCKFKHFQFTLNLLLHCFDFAFGAHVVDFGVSSLCLHVKFLSSLTSRRSLLLSRITGVLAGSPPFVAMISTKFIRFSFDKLARTHKIARSFSPCVLVPKPVLTGSAYVTHAPQEPHFGSDKVLLSGKINTSLSLSS